MNDIFPTQFDRLLIFLFLVFLVGTWMVHIAKTPAERAIQADLTKHILSIHLIRGALRWFRSRKDDGDDSEK